MKFSIIVPVYNSANFLPDCLAGVKNQSFDDWELIFIDDGSTDGSRTILDGYARSDDRIHVFHQENSGQFFAREKGIAMSKGEYILFLDSDDDLMPDCLEKLYEVICESKPDMIMFAYRVSYDDGKEDIERGMIFSEKKKSHQNGSVKILYQTTPLMRCGRRLFAESFLRATIRTIPHLQGLISAKIKFVCSTLLPLRKK